MPTFKNISTAVFQDGDLIVSPGESFSTEDEGRINQMRGQYDWQFDESETEAPSEGEVAAHPEANDVREIRGSSHVELDEDGNQAEVVGSPEPAEGAPATQQDDQARTDAETGNDQKDTANTKESTKKKH